MFMRCSPRPNMDAYRLASTVSMFVRRVVVRIDVNLLFLRGRSSSPLTRDRNTSWCRCLRYVLPITTATRFRQRPTSFASVSSSAAIALFVIPSDAIGTIRARSRSRTEVLRDEAHLSSVLCASFDRMISAATRIALTISTRSREACFNPKNDVLFEIPY